MIYLVLLGPPGSGKGTLATALCEREGLNHISTGDLLRQAVETAGDLGCQVREYLASGSLVPDETVATIVRAHLTERQGDYNGAVLDGYPRTLGQANDLKAILAELGQALTAAILIDVPEDVLLARLTGRRSCPGCHLIYHITGAPPREEGRCDGCGSTLVHRPDDESSTIRRRMELFEMQTPPLKDFYQADGCIVTVRGDRDACEIVAEVDGILALRTKT